MSFFDVEYSFSLAAGTPYMGRFSLSISKKSFFKAVKNSSRLDVDEHYYRIYTRQQILMGPLYLLLAYESVVVFSLHVHHELVVSRDS